MDARSDAGIPPVAALEDPVRRRIYAFVRAADGPVTREEVAAAAGVSRKLAAFHLDRLLERDLLVSHYARPPGRSGRGAGRSSKYYAPSDVQITVSIPERRYDLAGSLLVDAIEQQQPGETARDATMRVARARGAAIGEEHRRAHRLRRTGADRALAAGSDILTELGFEPVRESPRSVALRNCPFHTLATTAPDLVCGMNQAFIDGLLRGLGNASVTATLRCRPGDCCVALEA